jgi:hypothetical protein
MIDTTAVIRRAAEKSGFRRVNYVEKDIPDDLSKVTVLMFFGDLRSTCAMSAMLLKRFREEVKGSRYFILCSWPGYAGLFPFVNEYWEIADPEVVRRVQRQAHGMRNESDWLVPYKRSLNWFFEDVVDDQVLRVFYDGGLTDAFLERFKHVKRFLPMVPSSTMLGDGFVRDLERPGFKVFLSPTVFVDAWDRGRCVPTRTSLEFWYYLARELVLYDMVPVVYQNEFTHDLSPELSDQAVYFTGNDVMRTLAAMRATGCVLDVFNGFSRLAMAARTPYIAVDIRNRYNVLNEWEVKGICCEKILPRDYIFSFSTILTFGLPVWKSSLFDIVVKRLKTFQKALDRNTWPTTSESVEIVPYREVQQPKIKKLAPKFIRIPKIDLERD